MGVPRAPAIRRRGDLPRLTQSTARRINRPPDERPRTAREGSDDRPRPAPLCVDRKSRRPVLGLLLLRLDFAQGQRARRRHQARRTPRGRRQVPLIEEGIPFHFEVPSEFIGRGVDPTRVDMYSDPDVGDTWTATALNDDGTAITISQDADSTIDLWHARDGATDIEFLAGDLQTAPTHARLLPWSRATPIVDSIMMAVPSAPNMTTEE